MKNVYTKTVDWMKKNKVLTGLLALALVVTTASVSIFFTPSQAQKVTAQKVKVTTPKDTDYSKSEKTSKITDKSTVADLAKDSGVSEIVITKATGNTSKTDVKLPTKGELKVLSNVKISEKSENNETKYVATIVSENTKKDIPVAKPKDGTPKNTGKQTIVTIQDESENPVADAITVNPTVVNGKTTYEEKGDAAPHKLTSEEIKKEVKTTENKPVEREVIETKKPDGTVEHKDPETSKPVEVKPTETVKPVEAPKPVEEPARPEPKTRDPHVDKNPWKEETRTRTVTVDEEYTENTTEDVYETKQLFDDWLYLSSNGVRYQELGWYDDFPGNVLEDLQLKIFTEKGIKVSVETERKVRETKKVKVGTKTVPVTKVRKVQKQETYTVWVNVDSGTERTTHP
jgi:hypothetical protein